MDDSLRYSIFDRGNWLGGQGYDLALCLLVDPESCAPYEVVSLITAFLNLRSLSVTGSTFSAMRNNKIKHAVTLGV